MLTSNQKAEKDLWRLWLDYREVLMSAAQAKRDLESLEYRIRQFLENLDAYTKTYPADSRPFKWIIRFSQSNQVTDPKRKVIRKILAKLGLTSAVGPNAFTALLERHLDTFLKAFNESMPSKQDFAAFSSFMKKTFFQQSILNESTLMTLISQAKEESFLLSDDALTFYRQQNWSSELTFFETILNQFEKRLDLSGPGSLRKSYAALEVIGLKLGVNSPRELQFNKAILQTRRRLQIRLLASELPSLPPLLQDNPLSKASAADVSSSGNKTNRGTVLDAKVSTCITKQLFPVLFSPN